MRSISTYYTFHLLVILPVFMLINITKKNFSMYLSHKFAKAAISSVIYLTVKTNDQWESRFCHCCESFFSRWRLTGNRGTGYNTTCHYYFLKCRGACCYLSNRYTRGFFLNFNLVMDSPGVTDLYSENLKNQLKSAYTVRLPEEFLRLLDKFAENPVSHPWLKIFLRNLLEILKSCGIS